MAIIAEIFAEYPELTVSYVNPAVVLGLFRHMAPHAQDFLMTIVFMQQVRKNDIQFFLKAQAVVLPPLLSKGILLETGDCYQVNPKFCEQLLDLLKKQVPCSLRKNHKVDKRRPELSEIRRVSERNWDSVINYLIRQQSTVSSRMISLSVRAGLYTRETDGYKRTAECFKFLLKPKDEQIQLLLRQIIRDSLDRNKAVDFLYNLSVGELYRGYSVKNVDLNLILELTELGLIFRLTQKSKRFYLTAGIIGLLTDSPKGNPNTEKFMLIETNFRVYAYTSSLLHIDLLSYMLELKYQLPNLVIGFITKKSIIAGFKKGLQASLIITFLTNHTRNTVPENVMNQIHLWEKERFRVLDSSAVMLQEFVDLTVYKTTLTNAEETGALLWNSPERNVIILLKSKAEPVIKELNSFK